MRNIFNIDNDEKTRILSLHENSTKKQYLNLIVEQEQTTSGGTTNDTWLKFPGDKTYEYLKKDNKWFTRRVGTTKEFDLSTNTKYKSTVDKLNKQFPDGKAPAGGEVKTATLGTAITPQGTKLMDELEKNPAAKSVIDALKKANFDFNQMKPEQLLPTLQKQFGDFLQQNPSTLPQIKTDIENLMKIKLPEITPATNVAVKNETLPGAPVYYPWIQDGKVNTEKLKQSVEDNSIYKWTDELKKLTPEQLTKVSKDFVSSGIPDNLTTTKGTGIRLAVNDVLKTAEKMVANAQPQGGSQPQGGDGSPAIVGGEQTSLESL